MTDPLQIGWGQRVLLLSRVLRDASIPHAFGGAIAMNYHREPRSTLDIDINIFLDPNELELPLAALQRAIPSLGDGRLTERLARDGQARADWDGTFVDLFFTNTAFHEQMALRVVEEPFLEGTIYVLSVEDLVVCKALFDRPKDWVDIAAVAAVRGDVLDWEYVRHWVGEFVAASDPRFGRLEEIERDR